jgi:alpha,alpha-trehalose phosphorylase
VDDNAYTNLMARLNLNYAAATMRRLRDERPGDYVRLAEELAIHPDEMEEWTRAAACMYVPHDPTNDITPQEASVS